MNIQSTNVYCTALLVLPIIAGYQLSPPENKTIIFQLWLVVVDQFTPGYQFTPTLNFLENL